MRSVFVFLVLVWLKAATHLFYRHRAQWVTPRVKGWWRKLRVICILNHTSLYEVLLVGYAPVGLVWRIARHGVLPLAEKTARRPLVGRFFRSLMRHVVVITRQRDHTWDEVLNRVDTRAIVTILPEGRMMRKDGLDSSGRPMTVRGGIADILEVLRDGHMLLLYSAGLHHVQAPGELLPRLFRTLDVRFEMLDIPAYNAERLCEAGSQGGFKHAVVSDLERRRDLHCPRPGGEVEEHPGNVLGSKLGTPGQDPPPLRFESAPDREPGHTPFSTGHPERGPAPTPRHPERGPEGSAEGSPPVVEDPSSLRSSG